MIIRRFASTRQLIEAREIDNRPFASAADAKHALAAAPIVTLAGLVKGTS